MIKKVIFLGDYYRSNQDRNVKILFGLISPLFIDLNIEMEILSGTNQYANTEKWIESLSRKGDSALKNYDLVNSAVIGFEINPIDKSFLNHNNIPWIDVEIHPIRFLEDLYLSITTSFEFNSDVLSVINREIQFTANTLKLKNLDRVYDIEDNSLLIIGQSPNDKSVFFDDEFKSLLNYIDFLGNLCEQYDKIYYRPHPYLTNSEIDEKILSKFNASLLSDISYYDLLSSSNIVAVCGISSSSLHEAKYFGKEVIFLEERVKKFSKPIKLKTLLEYRELWYDKLLSFHHLNTEELNFLIPDNTCRNLYGYWAYETPFMNLNNALHSTDVKVNELEVKTNLIETRFHKAKIDVQVSIAKVQVNVADMQVKVNEAQANASEAWHQYNIIENSNSWKMTKPLRLMGKFIRWFILGSKVWLTFSPTSRPRRVFNKISNSLKVIRPNNKLTENDSIFGCRYDLESTKPLVLMDMYVLGQGVKTGIYRVCDELYKRLVNSSEFNFNYLAKEPFYSGCDKYIKENKFLCATNEKRLFDDMKEDINFFLAPFGVAPENITSIDSIKQVHIIYDLIAIHHPEYFTDEGALEVKRIIDSLTHETIIFAISEYTKRDLLNYRKDINPEQVTVIPLAADDKFLPCVDKVKQIEMCNRYGIPHNMPYILSLATLEIRKNLETTVDAFYEYIKNNPESKLNLVLAGMTGWKLEQLQEKINENSELSSRIIFTGFIDDDDLASLYSRSVCFIYLSRYEGFGLPPLEAMACGVPVITSDNSSLPEVVGDAGLMFDCNDYNGVADAIKEIFENQTVQKELSGKSLERAKMFNWDITADIVLDRLKKEIQNVK